MSVKEIQEAIENGTVCFGVRQAVKKGKKAKAVYICKDARDVTVEKLESAQVEFIVLKNKSELARELNLDFASEVYTVV